MMLRPSIAVCLALLVESAGMSPVHGEPPAGNILTEARSWRLDKVTLDTGEIYHGLIESENDQSIRLLEIRRPQGRGMFGLSRSIHRPSVAAVERLSAEQRAATRERFEQFRNRARVEAGRMDELRLEAIDGAGQPRWRYRGAWFTAESSAPEEITRRALVRIEQVFTAFRQMAPPRVPAARPLTIVLLGSTAEYRAFLQAERLPVDNPAIFAVDRNLIVAGSDLTRFSQQLAKVRAQHAVLRTEIDRVRDELPERLKRKRQQLDASGGSEAAHRKAMLNFKRQCEEELAALQRTLDSYDRRNDGLFEELTGRMFAMLYHEGLHAYLENYVYPHRQFDVPRWLNEGLAQIFEAGLLEADTLRVDAPNKPALETLQADLRSKRPLALSEVLRADHRSFLLLHGGRREAGALHYAHSWGLAHYLAFEQSLLGSAALDEYVAADSASLDPVYRFERLIGMPIEAFEPKWRQYILDIKPPGKPGR